MEAEKITVNLPPVELGKIDLVVARGLYASRADFLRTAVRRLLEQHDGIVEETRIGHHLYLGNAHLTRANLEELRRDGKRIAVRILGLLEIADDVTPELADTVLERVFVVGALRAPQAVVARLGSRVAQGPHGLRDAIVGLVMAQGSTSEDDE